MYVNVKGGTNAGTRRMRDRQYIPWACGCDDASDHPRRAPTADRRKLNPGYLVRCIDCGVGRDDIVVSNVVDLADERKKRRPNSPDAA